MTTNDELELEHLAVRMGEAERKRDVPFLRGILADDLWFRRASGKVVNKAQYLKDLESSENSYEYLESEDVAARVWESVGVVALRVRAAVLRGGTRDEGVFRNLRLFERRGEGWKCVAWLNTRVSDRGVPKGLAAGAMGTYQRV